jgi:hypothetical protein
MIQRIREFSLKQWYRDSIIGDKYMANAYPNGVLEKRPVPLGDGKPLPLFRIKVAPEVSAADRATIDSLGWLAGYMSLFLVLALVAAIIL